MLSFVTGGRLRGRLDRLIVTGIFISAFVLDVVSMLFADQPGNVLLAFRNEAIFSAVDGTQRA